MTEEQQLTLPFDFTKEEKQVTWENLPHYERPANDNERLLELQYQFRVNGNKKALDDMYRLGYEISYKYINTMVEADKHLKMTLNCAEKREEKAHNAVCYMIQSYLKKPTWVITDSWTGYLYRSTLKQVKGGVRKVDKIVDFVDIDSLFREMDDRLSDELMGCVMDGNTNLYNEIMEWETGRTNEDLY